MPLFVCLFVFFKIKYALYFSCSHKMTGFLKYCNCKFLKRSNYSLLSLCNVEECRCARKKYLCFCYFHTVYAIYAVNNVNVHVKYVKDT